MSAYAWAQQTHQGRVSLVWTDNAWIFFFKPKILPKRALISLLNLFTLILKMEAACTSEMSATFPSLAKIDVNTEPR
jgi:hypothetical protein